MEQRKSLDTPVQPPEILTNPPEPNQPDRRRKVVVVSLLTFLLLGLSGTLAYFVFSTTGRINPDNSISISPEPTATTPTVTPNPTSTPITSTLPPLPTVKVIPGRTHTFQTFNNCGPATLSMALSYFGTDLTQKTLGDSLRPYQISSGDNDDKSVSLAEITAKAKELGLIAYHRPAGDIETLRRFIAADIPVITRTWLHLGEDISHYRLVRGYDHNSKEIIQDDSYTNKNLRFSYEDFLALWESFNFEYIVIANPDKKVVIEQILGTSLDENSSWERSLAISNAQLVVDPTDIWAKFNASLALYHLGRSGESVRLYEEIQTKLPRRMLWYQLEPLLAYYQLGNYDRVLSMSQNILDNGNRAYSELYYLRGKIYESRGQPELASQNFALADRYNTSSYWRVNLEFVPIK